MKKLYTYLVVCSMIVVSLISCERRDLDYDIYPYCDVTVNIDWSKAFSDNKIPSGVSIWLYPENGSKPIKSMFTNTINPIVSAKVGKYDIVVFNQIPTDFRSLGFRGTEKLSTFEIYSMGEDKPEPEWYAVMAKCDTVVKQPEIIALTFIEDFEITEAMVEETAKLRANSKYAVVADTINVINVTPIRINKRANVTLKIDGLHNLRSVRGYMSSMAESYSVADSVESGIVVSHLITSMDVSTGYGEGELYIDYSTLGLATAEALGVEVGIPDNLTYWKGVLYLEFLLVDGKTVVNKLYPLDNTNVSETIVGGSASAPIVETIIEINISEQTLLPDVVPDNSDEGGFGADVGDWEDNNVLIPV